MFSTCMLHDDSLLNEIVQATMSDPFATNIMTRLNNPSGRKCKARSSVTLQLRMGYSFIITSFTSQLAHVAPEYYKLATMILLSATLGSWKCWRCCLGGFGGPNLGNWSKNLSKLVTFVLVPKRITIIHTAFYTHFQFPVDLGFLSPWPLSPTFLGSVTMTLC